MCNENNNQEKAKITFLFGSGADSCFNGKLQSGQDFIAKLLTDEYSMQRKEVLGERFTNTKFIHPNSKKVYAQTLFYNEKEAKNKKLFDKKIIEECKKYYQSESKASPELDEYFSEWYKIITGVKQCFEGSREQEIKQFFLKNATLFDTLDEKFNSLRFPHKLNNNAKRVINAYWIIFFYMFESIYNMDDKENLTLEKIYSVLNDESKCTLYGKEENYYCTLSNSKFKYSVSTTNYTDFIQKLTQKNDIAYLHGKLSWFEDLDSLIVYDCTKPEELESLKSAKQIIPFILITSGVKPIVCKRQIEHFCSFIKHLDGADELCVVGYKFNSEDNHINSIIGEWLSKPKKHMTYLDYENSVDFNLMGWSKKFKQANINCSTDVEKQLTTDKKDIKIHRLFVNECNDKEEKFKKIFIDYVAFFNEHDINEID